MSGKEKNDHLKDPAGTYREMAMNLPVPAAVIQKGRFVHVNNAFAKFTGYGREELMAIDTILFLVAEDDHKRIEEHFIDRARGAIEDDSVRFGMMLKDGKAIDVEVRESAIHFEERPAVLGIFTDVTDKKIIEERLKQAEDRFRYASRATQEILWERDLENNRMWCSEGIRVFFKIKNEDIPHTFEEWIGRVHDEDREKVLSALDEVIKNRHHLWLDEYRFKRGDDKYAHVLDRAFVLYDKNGKAMKMIGSMLDTSEKKQLENQLHQAQRLGSVGALTRGIAHDMNNVLAPILASIQALREDLFLEESTKEILETMETNCKRGAKVVRQVLNLAEARSGATDTIELQHQLRDIVSILQETLPRNIVTELEAPQDLYEVKADAADLDQVFLNLCVNARDAMPNGGNITITAENVELDEYYAVMQHNVKPGWFVRVSVRDTGKGIPTDQLKKIFLPFQKLDPESKGQGLGLTTVMRIVKTFKGIIEVDSKVGQGTRFDIYFPAIKPARPEDAEEDASEGAVVEGKGEMILIADDEEPIREVAKMTLERHGYNVTTASNGADAITAYCQASKKVNVIVMDIMMPNMDGISAINVIRRIDPTSRILVSSGSLRSRTELDATGVKVEGFLRKPYTGAQLLEAVNRVIEFGKFN